MSKKKLAHLKELSESEQSAVSGGESWGDKMDKFLPADHGIHIGMYDAENHIGEKVYAVYDSDREDYFYGTLVKSWEFEYQDLWITRSKRKHTIYIEGKNDYWKCNNYTCGEEFTITGNNYTLYLYK